MINFIVLFFVKIFGGACRKIQSRLTLIPDEEAGDIAAVGFMNKVGTSGIKQLLSKVK